MSVIFYDADNPPVFLDAYVDDYNRGIWLNYSNANGARLLYYMGLNHEELYGEMDGSDFRRYIHRGLETVTLLNLPQKDLILIRYHEMMNKFKSSKIVKWE